MAENKKQQQQDQPQGEIASLEENQALKHSVDGITTRDDGLDAGVPMLPGDPKERQGPEDALGPGPKRGDYSSRVGPSDYQPHEAVRGEDGRVRLVPQRQRAEQRGDAAGKKGGVETREERR